MVGVEGLKKRRGEEAGGKATLVLGARGKARKSDSGVRETANGACNCGSNRQNSGET